MKASNLIKEFEGFKLKAYLDSVGIPTIGYGSTFYEDGSKVKMGDVITAEKADLLLSKKIATIEYNVRKKIFVPLSELQMAAIISLVYNIGDSAFAKSTLLKKLNAYATKEEISFEWLRWCRAGGKVLKGLEKRRKKELELFYYEEKIN